MHLIAVTIYLECATVKVNPPIANNIISSAQTICSGATPAILTGAPTGGNGTYAYIWESSTTNATDGFSSISGGTGQTYSPGALTVPTWYRRTVTSGGCSSVSSAIKISINPLPAQVTVQVDNQVCNTATLNASLVGPGTIYYMETISGRERTTDTRTSVTVNSSGTYYFRAAITSTGCWGPEGSGLVTITDPPSVFGAIVCQGESGDIRATCPAGNGTINWYTTSTGGSPIGTGSPFNPVGVLNSGLTDTNTPGTTTYWAECTLMPGCRIPADFVIDALPTISGATKKSYNGSDLSCASSSDGEITVTASGTSALQYSKDNGVTYQISNVFIGLGAGTYQIKVRNVNLCESAPTEVIIIAPDPITVSNVSQSTIACNGGTATVTITAAGGTGTLSYTFDGVTNTTGIFTHAAGTGLAYSVTDANNCTAATGTFDVVQPAVISVSNVSQSVIACNGGTATVTITAAGGTGTLSYTFDGVTNTTGIFTHAAGTGLAYSVTDANNCTAATGTFDVVQPAAISVSNVSQSVIACNGGTATVTITAAGGTGTLSYTFDGVTNTTGIFTHAAGTGLAYSVTDANNCTAATGTFDVVQPAVISVSNVSQSVIACNGGTATVTITAAGGTGTLSYTFDGVTNTTGIFTHAAGTGLAYSVTDANNCTAATGTFDVVQPAVISVSNVSQSVIACNGGTATVTITAAGGTGTLSYTFDGVTNTTGIFTHAAGTGLAYSVTDANNCTAATGTFDVVQPAAISVSNVSQSVIACNGGTATVTITAAGGTGTLSYTFDGVTNTTGIFTHAAGTGLAYSVTDANNCTAATGTFDVVQPAAISVSNVSQSVIACNGGTATVTITAAGGTGTLSYTFDGVTNTTGIFTHAAGTGLAYSVTDANNCTAATGTFDVVEPAAISVSNVSQSTIACNGGTATVTITAAGGTGTLSYTFDGVTNTTGIFTHAAGTGLAYSVTDANNCTAATGTFDVVQPAVISVSNVSQSVITCNGGTATVTITAAGGTGTLSYTFDGVTNTTGIFTHAAGTGLAYSVTDANNCTAATGTFDVVQPAAISVSNVSQSVIACNGGTATVTITAAGGTAPLSYTFDGVGPQVSNVFTHVSRYEPGI